MPYFMIGLSILVFSFSARAKQDAGLNLTTQLKVKAEEAAKKSPVEVKKVMQMALDQLKAEQLDKKALKKGNTMPAFQLVNQDGKMIRSEDLLKKGPMVVIFYRGGWCPYCNLQLRDLQKHLDKIKAKGAELVAISPESPDQSLETVKKQKLGYQVLSDADMSVGESFGLMFTLPEDLQALYKKFGIDLQKHNGNHQWQLPLAAAYVVDKNSKITYSFVNVDYKKRAETLDIIKAL